MLSAQANDNLAPLSTGPDPRASLAMRGAVAGLAIAIGTAGLIDAATAGADLDLSVKDTATGVLATGRFVTAALSIAIVSMVTPLWRGKRWATGFTVLAGLGLAALVAASARPFVLIAVAIAAVITTLGRKSFATKSDSFGVLGTARRFAVGQIGIFAYGTIGLYFLDHHFVDTTNVFDSVFGALRLLFLAPAGTAVPATVHGAQFIESVRLLSLINIASTVLLLFVPLIRRTPGRDFDTAKQIVEDNGANRLAHFALWDDKSFAISPNHDGLVSYHSKGRVALALGGPIGTVNGRRDAIGAFVADCNTHGLAPAFHQVSEGDRELLEAAGFRLQHVGAEAIVDVQTFTLEGSHWKKVRSSQSQLARDSLAVVELEHPIADDVMAELQEVSELWSTAGGHRERTFTLGQFSPEYLQNTRVFVLRGKSGRLEAFVNVVPRYQSTEGTFDLMRRRPDSVNGAMDALFIAMIEAFKADGLTGMNMGMAPLAQLPGEGTLDRGFKQLRSHGEQWFNFEGLEKFKQKWEPQWEDRFVAYRTAAELPPVLRCIQTIGEIADEDVTTLDRIKPIARRLPATLTLGGFILWLMAATAFDPAFHQTVIDGFGLSWPDLFDLDVWRIAVSSLVQTDPGFVGGNALMVLTVMPAVEWLFGTRRTLLTYWLGSLITMIPVLFLLRGLGELGDLDALDFVYSRDAGSSAGLWALAGTLVTRIPKGPWRYGVLAALVSAHVGLAVFVGGVANVQHIVATLVGFGLGMAVIEGSLRQRIRDAVTSRFSKDAALESTAT